MILKFESDVENYSALLPRSVHGSAGFDVVNEPKYNTDVVYASCNFPSIRILCCGYYLVVLFQTRIDSGLWCRWLIVVVFVMIEL